jgi:rRNA-processing protein FCF1
LLGLEVFLGDLGWSILKAQKGRSDDDVLRSASEANHILVTKDTELAERCRLKGVRVVELGMREAARLLDQILRANHAVERRS